MNRRNEMAEEYTYFNKISERISLIEKYQKFEEDETVRCTEKQYDDEGVLEKNSVLIVQDVMLARSGIEKTKNGEIPAEDDIEYMCYHVDTEKIFWIKGNQLKKAVDKEADDVLNKYHKQNFHKEIYTNIVGGLLFTILILFCDTIAIFFLGKLTTMTEDLYNNIYIKSLFILTAVGFLLIIGASISSYCEYIKKKDRD